MTNKDEQQKKKKKKTMMLNRCSRSSSSRGTKKINNNNNNNNIFLLDNDFVVYEILTRLPVKTLMQFQSVCKNWSFTINHNVEFHHLQFNHHVPPRRLLRQLTISAVSYSYFREITGYKVSDADLEMGADYHTFRCDQMFHSVHGLVCVSDEQKSGVRIYNPSTRQETQWIDTPKIYGRIEFGFDPITKKHKVLYRRKSQPAMVLTVGESWWRKMEEEDYNDDDQIPKDHMSDGPSVYLNGSIYWMEKEKTKNGKPGAAEVLVAFDVGSEKFRVIPLPDYIINQPRDESYHQNESMFPRTFTDDLLEVSGHVALLRRKNRNTVSMWMLSEDDALHRKNWNCWNEVVITLPLDWVGENDFVEFSNLPGTDQIIVKLAIDSRMTIYSHNWKKNYSEKPHICYDFEDVNYDFEDHENQCESLEKKSEPEYVTTESTHFMESLFAVN